MTESDSYKCTKCEAVFRPQRWANCSNCGEPVPDEIREKFLNQVEDKVASWQSLLNISSPPKESVSRKERIRRGAEQLSSSWDPAVQISADARAIVKAQNKTTQAVRSLALFLFISLQSGLFGGGLVSLVLNSKSNYDDYGQLNSGASFLVLIGALTAFVGFIVGVIVGKRELDKSRV